MRNFSILGFPGAGKGTQARALSQKMNLLHICVGDVLRRTDDPIPNLNHLTMTYMSQGRMIPDDSAIEIVANEIKKSAACNGWVLDGFPGTMTQALEFNRRLLQEETSMAKVFYLDVPTSVVISRMKSRARAEDKDSIIEKRIATSKQQLFGLLQYFDEKGMLVRIDGSATEAEVFSLIWDCLEP